MRGRHDQRAHLRADIGPRDTAGSYCVAYPRASDTDRTAGGYAIAVPCADAGADGDTHADGNTDADGDTDADACGDALLTAHANDHTGPCPDAYT